MAPTLLKPPKGAFSGDKMRIWRALTFLAALGLSQSALAQSAVQQGGSWSAGHVPQYTVPTNRAPIVQDGGGAGGGAIGVNPSEIGITERSATNTYPALNAGNGPNYSPFCIYDGPTTGPYHYICLGPNSNGTGLLTYGAGGGATQQPLYFNVNGASVPIAGGTLITIGSTTVGGTPSPGVLYNNNGTLGALSSLPYGFGGTGLTSLGAPNQCLTTNGVSSAMAWQNCAAGLSLTIGSTTITGGTSGNFEFNNGGVIGEKTPGTGVASAFTNAVNGAGGFVTYAVTSLPSLIGVSTITSGTWNASPITYPYGGTGLSVLGTANQCLTTNGSATAMAWATCGSVGLTGTPSAGQLTDWASATNVQGITTGTGVVTALGSNVTGSGGIVLATSPTLITPALGTPTALTLTSATGLPISTGVSGLGSGVATALALGTGASGGFPPVSGSVTNGHCVQWGASGVLLDAGGSCTTGGGGGTVNAGTAGQVAYYATSTNAVSGTTTGTGVLTAIGNNVNGSGGLVTSAATSLASLATVGTIGTGVWQGTAIGTAYGGTGLTSLGTGVAAAFANAVNGTGGFLTYAATSAPSLATVGTIGTGTWQGTAVGTAYGGTGLTSLGTGVASAFANNVNGTGGFLTYAATAAPSLATVGTIGTGVWQGTAVGYAYGGTGLTALGSANQCLTTNAGATAMAWQACAGAVSLTIGSTAISGGTSGKIEYNNGGVLGEYSVGTGFVTAMGNAVNGSGGLLTYSLFSTPNTYTATQTLSGSSSTAAAVANNIVEPVGGSGTLSGSTAATIYPSTASFNNYTSNPSAAYAVNITWSAGTTVNSVLSTGQMITVGFAVLNGATAYLPSAYQVDGTNQTCNWAGGSSPSSADASVIDVYNFTVIKTGSAAYTLLCNFTKF